MTAVAEAFLPPAHDIAHKLVTTAVRSHGYCTWTVASAERDDGSPRNTVIGGTLYRGTAGVALFLIEAYRVFRDPALRGTSEAAIRYALHEVKKGSNPWGFYSGAMGLAHVLLRYRQITESDQFTGSIPGLVAAVDREHESIHSFDLVNGLAGTVLGLIQIDRVFPTIGAGRLAEAFGNSLASRASRTGATVSWLPQMTLRHAVRGNLTGFAHGASGIAHALFHLSKHLDEPRFREAAAGGVQYENELFDRELNNWPDLRLHPESDDSGHRPIRSPMSAWCHGAVGIGYMRAGAWLLTGDDAYKADAAIALTTATRPDFYRTNFSLCHGAAGTCDFSLFASRTIAPDFPLGPTHARLLEEAAIRKEQNSNWPSGLDDGAAHPSLMLGEAGVGHMLLRFADSSIPSVLLPDPRL